MIQTALGEKLQRSGFIPREVRFSVAIAKSLNVGGIAGLLHFVDGMEELLNNGGTIERARQLIAVAADKMGSGGHDRVADKALVRVPPASQPDGSEGPVEDADKAQGLLPSLPPDDSAAGRQPGAKGQESPARPLSPHWRDQPRGDHGHFSTVTPAREPSKADRAAMASVAHEASVAVLTVFDRYKVRDGRPLKKLRFHELMKLAQEDESESRAFRYMVTEVECKYANPDPFAMVTDLISPEIAEKAFAFAKVAANAH